MVSLVFVPGYSGGTAPDSLRIKDDESQAAGILLSPAPLCNTKERVKQHAFVMQSGAGRLIRYIIYMVEGTGIEPVAC